MDVLASRRARWVALVLFEGSLLAGSGCSPVATPGPEVAPVRTGTLAVQVLDEASSGLVENAVVTVNPSAEVEITDTNGRATFTDLAPGTYTVDVRASGIRMGGKRVMPGRRAETRGTGVVVTEGEVSEYRMRLPRIDPSINLVALHDPASAGDAGYVDENCIACHGQRADERSNDPGQPAFHAIALAQVLPLGRGGCTYCHRTVDLAASSGATLGKQVDVKEVCLSCHEAYPRSFTTQGASRSLP